MSQAERAIPGQRTTARLLGRVGARRASGISPMFFARFGLEDPYAAPQGRSGADPFVFLSAAPYYAALERMRFGRQRLLARFDERSGDASPLFARLASLGSFAASVTPKLMASAKTLSASSPVFLAAPPVEADEKAGEVVQRSAREVKKLGWGSSPGKKTAATHAVARAPRVRERVSTALMSAVEGFVPRAQLEVAVAQARGEGRDDAEAAFAVARRIRGPARRAALAAVREQRTVAATSLGTALGRAASRGEVRRGLEPVLARSPSVAPVVWERAEVRPARREVRAARRPAPLRPLAPSQVPAAAAREARPRRSASLRPAAASADPGGEAPAPGAAAPATARIAARAAHVSRSPERAILRGFDAVDLDEVPSSDELRVGLARVAARAEAPSDDRLAPTSTGYVRAAPSSRAWRGVAPRLVAPTIERDERPASDAAATPQRRPAASARPASASPRPATAAASARPVAASPATPVAASADRPVASSRPAAPARRPSAARRSAALAVESEAGPALPPRPVTSPSRRAEMRGQPPVSTRSASASPVRYITPTSASPAVDEAPASIAPASAPVDRSVGRVAPALSTASVAPRGVERSGAALRALTRAVVVRPSTSDGRVSAWASPVAHARPSAVAGVASAIARTGAPPASVSLGTQGELLVERAETAEAVASRAAEPRRRAATPLAASDLGVVRPAPQVPAATPLAERAERSPAIRVGATARARVRGAVVPRLDVAGRVTASVAPTAYVGARVERSLIEADASTTGEKATFVATPAAASGERAAARYAPAARAAARGAVVQRVDHQGRPALSTAVVGHARAANLERISDAAATSRGPVVVSEAASEVVDGPARRERAGVSVRPMAALAATDLRVPPAPVERGDAVSTPAVRAAAATRAEPAGAARAAREAVARTEREAVARTEREAVARTEREVGARVEREVRAEAVRAQREAAPAAERAAAVRAERAIAPSTRALRAGASTAVGAVAPLRAAAIRPVAASLRAAARGTEPVSRHASARPTSYIGAPSVEPLPAAPEAVRPSTRAAARFDAAPARDSDGRMLLSGAPRAMARAAGLPDVSGFALPRLAAVATPAGPVRSTAARGVLTRRGLGGALFASLRLDRAAQGGDVALTGARSIVARPASHVLGASSFVPAALSERVAPAVAPRPEATRLGREVASVDRALRAASPTRRAAERPDAPGVTLEGPRRMFRDAVRSSVVERVARAVARGEGDRLDLERASAWVEAVRSAETLSDRWFSPIPVPVDAPPVVAPTAAARVAPRAERAVATRAGRAPGARAAATPATATRSAFAQPAFTGTFLQSLPDLASPVARRPSTRRPTAWAERRAVGTTTSPVPSARAARRADAGAPGLVRAVDRAVARAAAEPSVVRAARTTGPALRTLAPEAAVGAVAAATSATGRAPTVDAGPTAGRSFVARADRATPGRRAVAASPSAVVAQVAARAEVAPDTRGQPSRSAEIGGLGMPVALRAQAADVGPAGEARPGQARIPTRGLAAAAPARTALAGSVAVPGDVPEGGLLRGFAGRAQRMEARSVRLAAGESFGVLSSLADANAPEDLVRQILERGTQMPQLAASLPEPARRMVDRIVRLGSEAMEVAAAGGDMKLAATRSEDDGPPPGTFVAGGGRRPYKNTTPASAFRALPRSGSSRPARSTSAGQGSNQVMKLADKLMSLIHLAEAQRRSEAQGQVRMADEPGDSTGASASSSGTDKSPDVNIQALQREVLGAVLRDLEMIEKRRVGGSDGQFGW